MADRRLSISKSFRRLLTSGTESEDLDSDSVSEKSDKKDNTVEKKQFTVTLEREVVSIVRSSIWSWCSKHLSFVLLSTKFLIYSSVSHQPLYHEIFQ